MFDEVSLFLEALPHYLNVQDPVCSKDLDSSCESVPYSLRDLQKVLKFPDSSFFISIIIMYISWDCEN